MTGMALAALLVVACLFIGVLFDILVVLGRDADRWLNAKLRSTWNRLRRRWG